MWAQRSVYLWSGGGRWWWEGVGDEEDGGGDSGGIATGTQKRGSKQGEALTSACFTLERERRKEKEEKQREEDRSENRKAGQQEETRQTAGGEEHREKQCVKCHGGTSGKCSLKARPQGGSRAQEVTLTKLRVAVRRLRREATTVPLRLRSIRLRFSPSSGSTPKRTSRNTIGCRGRKCLSEGGEKSDDLWGDSAYMLPCWGRWGCWCSPPHTHSSPCLRWGSWSEPALQPSIWASLMGCSLKTHTGRAGAQNTKIKTSKTGHVHQCS